MVPSESVGMKVGAPAMDQVERVLQLAITASQLSLAIFKTVCEFLVQLCHR